MNEIVKKIYEDTFVIIEDGLAGPVNCYLLVGEKKALLIDSGYGLIDLKKIVSEITDKEVICALTHGHMDHADGCYQFKDTFMHSKDRKLFKLHTSAEFIHKNWFDGVSLHGPKDMIKNKEVQEKLHLIESTEFNMPHKLDDIKYFDLGGRKVYWSNTPGHTEGCVCYYDEKYNKLFTGDNITSKPWIFFDESASVHQYKEVLENVQNFVDHKDINDLYPAHTKAVFKADNIEDLIGCCDKCINNPEDGRKFEFKVGSGSFYNKGKCILFAK